MVCLVDNPHAASAQEGIDDVATDLGTARNSSLHLGCEGLYGLQACISISVNAGLAGKLPVDEQMSEAELGDEPTPLNVESLVETEKPAPAQRQAATGERIRTHLLRNDAPPKHFKLDQLPKLVADDANLAWIDLSEYAETDLQRLAKLLKLHPISVQSALGPWRPPRLDIFSDHFYLATTVARADPKHLKVSASELGIWVGRNYVVTAHRMPVEFMAAVSERLHQGPELTDLHSAFVVYVLLDELLSHYDALLEELEDSIEETEERALRETSDEFLAHLLHLKQYVFALGRLAEQHVRVFAAFSRPDFSFGAGVETQPYFKDLQERLTRVADRLVSARESVNGAFGIYVSHVAHRTNALISVLTVISTVLFPATLIVTLTQTVFKLPLIQSAPGLFALAAALVLIPGAVFLVILRRRLL